MPVLAVGAKVPDVSVWTPARERVSIRTLAGEGAVLLLFYLFDWSST
jgi:peroxiredoxin